MCLCIVCIEDRGHALHISISLSLNQPISKPITRSILGVSNLIVLPSNTNTHAVLFHRLQMSKSCEQFNQRVKLSF